MRRPWWIRRGRNPFFAMPFKWHLIYLALLALIALLANPFR
jgi:hypothetical protein